jgi:anhydro-N-acetylmuramic acid kinase
MNPQIEKLYALSQKDSRLIIGLMSGTSLDGLDIALCRIHSSGSSTKLEFLQFTTKDYNEGFRVQLRKIFAKRDINQQQLSGLHAYIGLLHAQLIKEALSDWDIPMGQVDLIASHGQTVYHAPQRLTGDFVLPNSTLQIGDGDHIAVHTGIITVSDFRQKHIAAGGEGAPLAAYGDYLLYSVPNENRILLNIGGISNFTFLPQQHSQLQAFATDIGPGNTMMNQYMYDYNGQEMDKNGQMAAAGSVQQILLDALLEEDFLQQDFPKTTGPELFNLDYLAQKLHAIDGHSIEPADIMATLNAFSARAIADAILNVSEGLENVVVYGSGGGIHNPILFRSIQQQLPHIRFETIATLGMDPDAKEACLFAVLANETVAGSPHHVDKVKDSPAVCMGKISFPN